MTTDVDSSGVMGPLFDVAREAIIALLDARDFMGYQLSHAQGSISDELLEQIADEYFSKVSTGTMTLFERSALLALLIPDCIDVDTVSLILKCDIDQAQILIREVETKARLLVSGPAHD